MNNQPLDIIGMCVKAGGKPPCLDARNFMQRPRAGVLCDVSFLDDGQLHAFVKEAARDERQREIALCSARRFSLYMDSLMRAQGFRLTQRYWAYPDLKKPLFIMPCGSEKTFRAHLDALVALSADNPLHAKKWLLRLLYNAGLVQKFLPFIAVYTR